MAALVAKWASMDAHARHSLADVQAKVGQWTLQRARLEEEIVRRQEASRFAVPGGGGGGQWQQQRHQRGGGGSGCDDDGGGAEDVGGYGAPGGFLSPYAHANADLAAATAAASTGQGGGGPRQGVSFSAAGGGPSAPSVAGHSMRLRHAEVAQYDADRDELVTRLAQLGVAVSLERPAPCPCGSPPPRVSPRA